ncbi:MAG: carboxypeptidase regulatory-like domain-containing protein [Acidobacteria bacterium]|nr:carboxypeptidase regulatory-like domain-containing protein [Acidobacteriota bacterium]
MCAQKSSKSDDALDAIGEKVTVSNAYVTGSVVCADTGAPARFAKVMLKPVDADAGANDAMLANLEKLNQKNSKGAAQPDAEEKKKQLAQAVKMLSAMSDMMTSATVGADGMYFFANVKPGTYYVHAAMPGYVDPLSQFSAADFASKDPSVRAKIAAVAPVVTVSGSSGDHADLRLERGAAIEGRVVYDDGSPAVGWTVRTVYPDSGQGTGFGGLAAEDVDLAHIAETSKTDDRGRFRIAGLSPGAYMLHATMMGRSLSSSGFSPVRTGAGGSALGDLFGLRLNVYSGNVYRKSDAKTITVTAGEERSNEEIVVPLRALHPVSGHVLAKADSHPVNSGTVEASALDANGKPDPSLHFTATVHSDGGFRFDYLPGPATYLLTAKGAEDSVTTDTRRVLFSTIETRKSLHKYGSATTTITLGDTDPADVVLLVPEAPAETK